MSVLALTQKMPLRQKQAGKLLLSFFSLMLALTLISRGLDSVSIPTVTTSAITGGGVGRRIKIDGAVEAMGQSAVIAPAGYPILSLQVEEGSRVEQGDILAVLDLTTIEEELQSQQRALEKARISAQLEALAAETPESDPFQTAQRDLERAEEDYKRMDQESFEAISRAQQDLSRARKDRNELRSSGDYDDAELDEALQEIIKQQRAVEDAVMAAEKSETEAKRAIEDAETALEEARIQKEKDDASEALESQRRSLQYRLALLDIPEIEQKIAELEALLEDGGVVRAPQSGVVTSLKTAAGSVTSGDGILLLSDSSQGSVFRGTVSESEGEYLKRGDSGTITATGLSSGVSAAITGLALPEEKGGDYTVTVQLEDTVLEPGISAQLTVELTGEQYRQVVPLSALHSKGGSDTMATVYVLREKNTSMGAQTVVEEVEVEILERNDSLAAVSGVFADDDRVVSASSRSLSPGDRVREEV